MARCPQCGGYKFYPDKGCEDCGKGPARWWIKQQKQQCRSIRDHSRQSHNGSPKTKSPLGEKDSENDSQLKLELSFE